MRGARRGAGGDAGATSAPHTLRTPYTCHSHTIRTLSTHPPPHTLLHTPFAHTQFPLHSGVSRRGARTPSTHPSPSLSSTLPLVGARRGARGVRRRGRRRRPDTRQGDPAVCGRCGRSGAHDRAVLWCSVKLSIVCEYTRCWRRRTAHALAYSQPRHPFSGFSHPRLPSPQVRKEHAAWALARAGGQEGSASEMVLAQLVELAPKQCEGRTTTRHRGGPTHTPIYPHTHTRAQTHS